VNALRLHAAGDLRLHDEPAPKPRDGDALLRVTAVGLCGSDRHWYEEGGIGDAVLTRPLVLGHEFVGVIDGGPHGGKRVAVDPAIPCGNCPPCVAGRSHLCLHARFAGHGGTDGALRTALTWPERLMHPLPDSLGDAEATLLEPLGVALHAIDLGHVDPGARAGVFGCGPLGLLIVQALLDAGATVVAKDVLGHRLDAARGFGADLWDGSEVDVAFEVAGEDAALADAIAATRPGGRIVLVGIPASDRTSFRASAARRKGLTFLVSRRMAPTDLPRAIDLACRGRVALAPLVTARHPLGDWVEAFGELSRRDGVKVVLEP
jgi:L-iditol 2-dehydrogenase